MNTKNRKRQRESVSNTVDIKPVKLAKHKEGAAANRQIFVADKCVDLRRYFSVAVPGALPSAPSSRTRNIVGESKEKEAKKSLKAVDASKSVKKAAGQKTAEASRRAKSLVNKKCTRSSKEAASEVLEVKVRRKSAGGALPTNNAARAVVSKASDSSEAASLEALQKVGSNEVTAAEQNEKAEAAPALESQKNKKDNLDLPSVDNDFSSNNQGDSQQYAKPASSDNPSEKAAVKSDLAAKKETTSEPIIPAQESQGNDADEPADKSLRKSHRASSAFSNCTTSRCRSLPPVTKSRSVLTRCHYSETILTQKIIEAKRKVSLKDYFSAFSRCAHSMRINYKTRGRILEYFTETGRYINNPISPFSIHLAISLFDRYMSYLAVHGNDELKEAAAQDIDIVSAACLHLSSKVEDSWALCIGDVCKTFENGAVKSQAQVLRWEQAITKGFDFDVNSPTVLDFLYWMFELGRDDFSSDGFQLDPKFLWKKAVDWADESLLTHLLLGIPTHVLAAASLLVAITFLQSDKKDKISNLPKSIRRLLDAEDRANLKLATCVIQEIVEEKQLTLNSHQCASVPPASLAEGRVASKGHSTPKSVQPAENRNEDEQNGNFQASDYSKPTARTCSTLHSLTVSSQD